MKFHHLATLIYCMATAGLGIAQNCVRSISTNPKEPSNSEWPLLFPGSPESFKNTGFDWRPIPPLAPIVIDKTQNWVTPYAAQSGVINMKSPFETSNGSSTSYLWSNKTLDEMDWYWEDGWELLYMNLGFLPNGDPIDNKTTNSWRGSEDPTPDNAPYFILYNRYRGTMRLFANVWFTDVGQYDYVNVKIDFVGDDIESYSGIFRHVGGLDRALDQPTQSTSLISPRRHPDPQGSVNTSQWMAADFQLGFDPCQCRIPSKLYLTFETTDVWEMDLEVRTIALEKDLNKLNYDERNFLQWEKGQPGNTIYRSIEDLLKKYRDALEAYNDDLDDYNAPLNKLKIDVIDQAIGPLADGIANLAVPVGGVRDYLLNNKLKLWDEDLIIPEDSNQAKDWAVSVKTSLKNGLANQFDFLSTSLGIQEKPVAPQVPTGTFTEGRIQGDLTKTASFSSEPLFVPGTVPTAPGTDKYQISSQNFPAYNNIPGLFAMLTTPTLDLFANEDFYSDCSVKEIEGSANYLMTARNTYHLKLKNISYAINPALDFDMEKTRFSGAVKITLKGLSGIGTDEKNFIERYLENSNFNLVHKINEGVWVTELISDYYSLSEIQNVLFSLDRVSLTEYGSSPAQVVKDAQVLTNPRYTTFLNQWCTYMTEYIDKIELKVVADMYFKQIGSHGDQVNTFQVFTYKLFDAEDYKNSSIHALRSSGLVNVDELSSIYTYIPGDLELSGEIGVNHPLVLEVNGNEIVIKGERITILNGLTVAPGYSLRVIAKEYINIESESDLLPNVELTIEPFSSEEQNEPTVLNNSFLSSYCRNTYKANTVTATKRKELLVQKDQNKATGNSDNDQIHQNVEVFPNPIKKGEYLNVKSDEKILDVSLFDLKGARIGDFHTISSSQYIINAIPTGVYVLQVTTAGNVERLKLIIN